MRRIVCEECRKAYDFDQDDFCPRCGAFNPPVKTWGVDANGNVVRVDGLSEQNHAGSFVHKEVHREKAVRRAVGMDWNGAKGQTRRPAAKSGPAQPSKQTAQTGLKNVVWFVAVLIAVSALIQLLAFLFRL